ncbi:MAG TPA: hypothetical protein VMJ34_03040 [Bryobacteraceae bacterium]|nr:hypothetical protein [Bryobacteraceae bacterium]
MKVTQLSIFAENKPGHVLAPCRLLAENDVDIRALSLADTNRFGILRLIVNHWKAAANLLEEAGFLVRATEVVAVVVPDHPGGLVRVLAAFEGTRINIEYMYAFPFAREERAVLIFRFDDPDAAIQRLHEAGIAMAEREELFGVEAVR